MLPNIRSFALFAAISFPHALVAQELTKDDYPDPRIATPDEIQEHCNLNDNPNLESRLLSFDEVGEYPFQIIFCQQAHVSLYKCSTLSNLINFEFDIQTLFRNSGNIIDEDDVIASQFTGLYEAYDAHCTHILY